MAISDVQAALNNEVVSKSDVATVVFNGTNTVTSQISWSGASPVLASYSFAIPSGDTTGTAITFFTISKTGQDGTPIDGTIVAYDATNVIIETIPAGGTTPLYYMVATPPSQAAGGITLSNSDGADYPITDLGTTGPYTAPTSLVCFVEGTGIHTVRGEVPVEELVEGDLVEVLHDGAATTRAVSWIGRREFNLKTLRDPFLAQPIRIRRDAFAASVPARDVLVSPDHAVFVDGVLVPARLLVNGMTIVRERRMLRVNYFHIELDRHSIILAENLPTESYLDTGNRGFFQNGGSVVRMEPELFSDAGSELREAHSCAPFVHEAAAVRPIWQGLAARAEQLGHRVPAPGIASGPLLRLCANGHEFRPVCIDGEVHSFMLPSGTEAVRLVSRAARPCEMRPWTGDQRLLGISVSRIRVRDGNETLDLPLDGPAIGPGWWAAEQAERHMWRWTNGDAVLRLPEATGSSRLLELTISGGPVHTLPLPNAAADAPEAVAATA